MLYASLDCGGAVPAPFTFLPAMAYPGFAVLFFLSRKTSGKESRLLRHSPVRRDAIRFFTEVFSSPP
jgi:hypothetical protein